MPYVQGFLRIIQRPQRPGGPVDPGWSGGVAPPGQPGGPVDPGYGIDIGRPGPGGPVDPGYGIDIGREWPVDPNYGIDIGSGNPPYPDIGLPPFPSHPIVIPQPPEGTTPPDGAHPAHPIVIPPQNGGGDGTKALVFVKVPGTNGVWFLVDSSGLKPSHLPQPKGS